MTNMKYCINDQRLVTPKTDWGVGRALLAVILLSIGFIPGLIYIALRQRDKSCPMCNSKNWGAVPASKEVLH